MLRYAVVLGSHVDHTREGWGEHPLRSLVPQIIDAIDPDLFIAAIDLQERCDAKLLSRMVATPRRGQVEAVGVGAQHGPL